MEEWLVSGNQLDRNTRNKVTTLSQTDEKRFQSMQIIRNIILSIKQVGQIAKQIVWIQWTPRAEFKGHSPFLNCVTLSPAEKLAIDSGSRAANVLITHYIWRFQRFETLEGWGVGIQSIR